MKKYIPFFVFLGAVILIAPEFAFAQDIISTGAVVQNILNLILRLFMLVAVLYFVWGVITFIRGDKEAGKEKIQNGLIGLFIIVAFWGIIRIAQNTFGVDNNNQVQQQDVPCIQGINC